MIPLKAKELALDNGWRPIYAIADDYRVALDPLFFQALGKALGWRSMDLGVGHRWDRYADPCGYHAHDFYDLILTSNGSDCNDRKCGKCSDCKFKDYWNSLLGGESL